MLYGHRYNIPYEIASLTKIMTFWVVLKIVEEYQVNIREEMVSVEHLSSDIGGTSADLFPGEVYTV
jgi:D-alanyl-D-alanine carboxypeptidase